MDYLVDSLMHTMKSKSKIGSINLSRSYLSKKKKKKNLSRSFEIIMQPTELVFGNFKHHLEV